MTQISTIFECRILLLESVLCVVTYVGRLKGYFYCPSDYNICTTSMPCTLVNEMFGFVLNKYLIVIDFVCVI